MSKRNYIRKIITDKEALTDRSEEVNLFDPEVVKNTSNLVVELKDVLRAHKDMMAISAPQLGSPYRIFCVKFSDDDIKTFVNPMITKIEGKYLSIENSPSLDNKEFMIQRPERILLGYQTPSGEFKSDVEIKSPLSGVIDQMINMLDGILFFNYEQLGIEISEDYYEASPEDKEELHKWYKEEYLPAKMEALSEFNLDPEIKKMTDAVSFLTKLANKEVELDKVTVNKNELKHD